MAFLCLPGRARAPRHLPIRQVAGHERANRWTRTKKDKRDRPDRVRKSTHSGKPNRLQVKWPGTFTKPTPKELEDAPGKHIHFQGYMKASAPNVLQIALYRGRGMQWTSNSRGRFEGGLF